MEYIELEENIIQRNNKNGSVSFIPKDPANSDYQQYLKSLENAN